MWEEEVLVYFKALSQHLTQAVEENNETLSQNSWNSNPMLPDCESVSLSQNSPVSYTVFS
jgi:hypothetical protein